MSDKETQHSPLPWKLFAGWCDEADQFENQPLIVLAVNSYPAAQAMAVALERLIAADDCYSRDVQGATAALQNWKEQQKQ